ncbi:methyl-accepting chemotaxis protein [Paenibacillus xylaniclasticus]|uniref:methyl-accepting chemotaxis protein n=1 Tax=Paenibacillus xylaniclasticus TaxID=588083 RepID=UPI000FDAB0BA|nr:MULTISPECIES: methyl-accepting chemotaxis protein [Paenibacillus]GFN33152.1 putative sensory transducer protein YfmS [Paenibacillus curdlanolyticus]
MNEKIADLIKAASLIQESLHDDTHIIITDMEEVLVSLPGKQIKLPVPVGAKVDQLRGTVSEIALSSGVKRTEERGAEQFGFPYITTATPIFDEGEVVGVIGLVSDNRKGELLKENYGNLNSIMNEISIIIEETTAAQMQATEKMQRLSEFSDSIVDQVSNSETLISGIQYVASQSHLLGLNASIEAARAGEIGKGFEVVAREIKKLAMSSQESSTEIADQLNNMKSDLEYMSSNIHGVVGFIQEIAAKMEELNGSYEQLVQMAKEISDLRNG